MKSTPGALLNRVVVPAVLMGACWWTALVTPPPIAADALADVPGDERVRAVLALARRAPAPTEELAERLADWTTRPQPLGRTAVWAIGELRAPALPALRQVLHDPERDVLTRATAAVALSGWGQREDVRSWLLGVDTQHEPVLRVFVDHALRRGGE